jgi:hypothetical protein
VDQRSIEELFERNADMRLLEFRHNEPGKGLPQNNRAATSFGAESVLAETPDVTTEKAPRLRVAIAAAPHAGVIPGAVVGVAVDVFNDGNAPAPEAKLLLSVPPEAEFRSGTLRIDGREVQAPEQLFIQGLPIARLPGGTSSKVTFQLGVLPGVNTLYLQPRLQTNGVPVVGSAGISIKRGASAPAPAEAPKPFYELEDEEIAELPVSESTQPILPPVVPPPEPKPTPPPAMAGPEPAPKPAARTKAAPKPRPQPEPAAAAAPAEPVAVTPEPEPVGVAAAPEPVVAPEPPPEPPPEPAPAAAVKPPPAPPAPVAPKAPLGAVSAPEERMIRYRTLGGSDIALLERLFAAPVPGIIAHYVLISSIACCEPVSGEDSGGYGAFLKRDIELLGRALVHARMGKAPQYRIAQADLNGLAMTWQVLPQAFPPQRRLRRDLRRAEWTAIGGLIQPSERDATLRARIALLALAGATVDGIERRTADECLAALATYRSSVLAWLVPLCVASAGNEEFVIPSPPANVDDAGRRLVAVLRLALTS